MLVIRFTKKPIHKYLQYTSKIRKEFHKVFSKAEYSLDFLQTIDNINDCAEELSIIQVYQEILAKNLGLKIPKYKPLGELLSHDQGRDQAPGYDWTDSFGICLVESNTLCI